jgi:hypothetical protein
MRRVDRDRHPPNLRRVAIGEHGRLRSFGRIDMTRTALEGLGGKLFPTTRSY